MGAGDRGRPSVASLWLLCAIVAFGFALRAPSVDRDFNGLHAWKNIRHYQFAESMLETGNYFVGSASFTQPETGAVWYNRVIEAPLVDWLLVIVFKLFGVSIPAFRLTFIAVSLATVVLFFTLLRPFLGEPLAIWGAALLAATPLVAYFAGHGIGEQFILPGQLLAAVTAARALDHGATRRDHLAFLLSCLLLVLAKLTTGLMLAALLLAAVGGLLGLRHHGRLRTLAARWKLPLLAVGLPSAAAAGWLAWSYVGALHRNLLVEYPLADAGYWSTLLVRWREHLGLYLLVLVPVALGLFVAVLIRHLLGRGKGMAPTPFEQAILVLFAVNLVQFAVQSRPFIAHEYYSVTWVVPALLLVLAALRRLLDHAPRPLAIASVAAAVVLVVASVPACAHSLRWLNTVEQVPAEDREALRAFFEHRRQEREKYFVVAREPRWGYFAGVNIDLCYDWSDLVLKLERTAWNLEYLARTGIEYVVYPRYAIPDDVLAALDREPLVDPGPEHLKLGLVHRGRLVHIFRVTTGIARREPLPGEEPPARLVGWRVVDAAFRGQPVAEDGAAVIRSAEDAVGSLVSPPFVATGDALLFPLSGGPFQENRVEIAVGGEALYAARPLSEHPPVLFALDLVRCYGREVTVRVVDAMAWEGGSTAVGRFEQVWYASIRPVLERRGVEGGEKEPVQSAP